jgi:hypothetical protein
MSDGYIDPQAMSARLRRNAYLVESDIVVLRAYESNTPVSQAWIDYRQALRNITTQEGFPENLSWPTKPTE